jgi:hypothetical protein
MAAVLAAANPFITQYAQETRMYALLILLGLVAHVCWLHAFATDPPADGAVRLGAAAGFAVAFAAMLYTHNWAIFFGLATGAAGLVLLALAVPADRPRLLRTGLLAYGGALILYLPWLPTFLYQTAHTGAPWAQSPSLAALAGVPAKLLGETAEIALVLAAGAGLVAILSRPAAPFDAAGRIRDRARPHRRADRRARVAVLAGHAGWAPRYLAAAVPPFLLLAAAGLGHAGRLGVAGSRWRSCCRGRRRRRRGRRATCGTSRRRSAPSLRPATSWLPRSPSRCPCSPTTCPPGCATRR